MTTAITLPAGGEAFFRIDLTQAGNLTAQLTAGGNPASLALYDSQGLPIVQSDGQVQGGLGGSPSQNPTPEGDPLITQGLTTAPNGSLSTSYYLKIDNQGTDARTYSLTTLFTPSASTLQTVPLQAEGSLVVTGDFNGDGLPDLATATDGFTDVTVLLDNGDGTFRDAGSFNAGIAIQTLLVGDFTGDGRLDLLAANTGNNGVALLQGNGDGTFQSPVVLPVQGGNAFAVGDFAGDGHLDLAVADTAAGTVRVLLGNGNGTFQASTLIPVPGGPIALVTGDFNEDGRLDLAVADAATNQVTVLLNQGLQPGTDQFSFQNAGSFEVGTDPIALVAGDFQGDGRLDLATANYRSNNVTVLLGNGNGTFQTGGTYAVADRPLALVTADFNGDGQVDLATANYQSNNVTVLLGKGNGTFQSAGSFASGSGPEALVAADFNGDGHPDLAVANRASQDIEVLVGDGKGSFTPSETPNTTGKSPVAMVSGDFNGDGQPDLAVANRNSNSVTVLLGQGDGTFASAGSFAVGQRPVALAAGDFNDDGRLDLAVADYGSEDVTVLLGDGDGTFTEGGTIPLPGRPSALVAGDFEEDGNLDLAVAIERNADSSPGNSVVLLQGDGHGGFTFGRSFTVDYEPDALVAGDLNGDGHLDLAVADYASQDVTFLWGDGHGNFQNAGSYSVGGNAVALALGDLTGDGPPDLAVAAQSYYYSNVTVLLNDGHGNFQSADSTQLPTTITGLAVGDFNGDGRPDLVAANGRYLVYPYTNASTVTLLGGNGDGTFTNNGTISAGSYPHAVVAGDFTGDGRLDLAVADANTSDVTVLLGIGTGSFLSPILAPSPVESTPLVANLTGGTGLDAIVLSQTGQVLSAPGPGRRARRLRSAHRPQPQP